MNNLNNFMPILLDELSIRYLTRSKKQTFT